MSRAWISQRGFEVQDDAAVDAAGRQPAVRLPRGPMGITIATTRSPTDKRPLVSGRALSTTPAASTPGMYGGAYLAGYSARPPARKVMSLRFTATACTRILTSPGPGSGLGRLTTCRTPGPQNAMRPVASVQAPYSSRNIRV